MEHVRYLSGSSAVETIDSTRNPDYIRNRFCIGTSPPPPLVALRLMYDTVYNCVGCPYNGLHSEGYQLNKRLLQIWGNVSDVESYQDSPCHALGTVAVCKHIHCVSYYRGVHIIYIYI